MSQTGSSPMLPSNITYYRRNSIELYGCRDNTGLQTELADWSQWHAFNMRLASTFTFVL